MLQGRHHQQALSSAIRHSPTIRYCLGAIPLRSLFSCFCSILVHFTAAVSCVSLQIHRTIILLSVIFSPSPQFRISLILLPSRFLFPCFLFLSIFLTQKNNGVKLSHSAFEPMSSIYRNNNGSKAITSEGRDNLDHLQRSARSQQPQPNKITPQITPIGLWESFPNARTVQQMMKTMDRLIEDPLAYNTIWVTPYARGEDLNNGYRRRGRTPCEIKESEKEYKLRFDMPNMTKSDGSENGGVEEEEEWSAGSYGKYSSRIALLENVEFEKIKAERM